jgi:Ser/Thr protein kinase RdoA (MazF antagonist)
MMLLAADTDPLDAGGHVIAGYSTVRRLPDVELSLLKASHKSLVRLTCRYLKW